MIPLPALSSSDAPYLTAEGLSSLIAFDNALYLVGAFDREDKMLEPHASRFEVIRSVAHIGRRRVENYISMLKFSYNWEALSRSVGEVATRARSATDKTAHKAPLCYH